MGGSGWANRSLGTDQLRQVRREEPRADGPDIQHVMSGREVERGDLLTPLLDHLGSCVQTLQATLPSSSNPSIPSPASLDLCSSDAPRHHGRRSPDRTSAITIRRPSNITVAPAIAQTAALIHAVG